MRGLVFWLLVSGCAVSGDVYTGDMAVAVDHVEQINANPMDWASRGRSQANVPRTSDWYQDPDFALTETGELPRMHTGYGRALEPESTAVRARVWGHFAEVEVAQVFYNPDDAPIEARYAFPLPENSAVFAMEMRIGDRRVHAEIQTREQAQESYERAQSAGRMAALLDGERSNVFHQSLANIPPGARISVVLRYQQSLTLDSGIAEFVFPLVVGERYFPAGSDPEDVARVNRSARGRGDRSGRNVAISLDFAEALPSGRWWSPTHAVELDDSERRIELTSAPKWPNRDFVLRFAIAEREPRAQLFTGDDGFFTVYLAPPQLDADVELGRRELIFVIDTSGSMAGESLATVKRAMGLALASLRPVDTFNIITFASGVQRLWPKAVPVGEAMRSRAFAFIDRMSARGGTEMNSALELVLESKPTPGRNRHVLFFTDGQIGNGPQLVAGSTTLADRSRNPTTRTRLFTFGVGPTPNRGLLGAMATAGDGIAVFAVDDRAPEHMVQQLLRNIDRPVWLDPHIDWGGADVQQLVPARIPDLFVSRPVVVHGKLMGEWQSPPVLRVRSERGEHSVPLENRPLTLVPNLQARLWARAQIASAMAAIWHDDGRLAEKIRRLGLAHQIVTPFTSLIAVDEDDPQTRWALDGPHGADTYLPRSVLTDSTMVVGAAETKYSLDGGALNSPSMGSLGPRNTSPAKERKLRMRIRRVRGRVAKQMRGALLDIRTELEVCMRIYASEYLKHKVEAVFSLDIDGRGHVQHAEVIGDLGSEEAEQCVVQRLLELGRIPATSTKVELKVRF